MSPLTRRQLLALGAAGAGATVVGGTGLWWTATGGRGYTGGEDLINRRCWPAAKACWNWT